MTAIADLWTQTTGRFTALVGRYWLLASRPSAYFDKFIKDQQARELRQTIFHSILAISAIPLSLSALLSAGPFLSDAPPWLTTTLTSKYLFVGVVILATIPALLLTCLVYILIRASISDLVFIYFNVLTIYSIGAFAYLLVIWIVGLLMVAVLWITTGNVIWQVPFQPSLWMYFLIMVPTFNILAMYCYVPTLLVERSTRKSTFFASTICILYFAISAFFLGLSYKTTIGPITMFMPESQDLERCSRNDGGSDLTIASCTTAIDSGRYSRPYLRFAFINRGDAYTDKEQYEDAIKDYGEAIRLNPADATTFISRGDAYFNKGEYDRAIDDYSAAIRIDPRNAVAFSRRADAHFWKKEYDRAMEDYTAAISLDPTNPDGFYNRAVVLSTKKEYDRAIEDFSSALNLEPTKVNVLYGRAVALSMKQDYNRAMEDYNTVIRLDPEHVDALIDRGILYNRRSEYDRAIKDFDEAIRLDRTQARAFNSRGVSYDRKGLYKRGLDDYNEAVKLDSKLVAALLNRAALYFNNREYDRTIDDYSAVINLDPTNAEVLRSRGNAYLARRASGDAARAKSDLDAAKRLGK
jgi:tetratricopeptide (TPR) repeat protein